MAEKQGLRSPHLGVAARDGGIIVLEIGPKHAKYQVHKALLTHHSEYFRRALNGRWVEAEEQKVILEDVEPGTFNVFLRWLYTRTFPKSDDEWLQELELAPDIIGTTSAEDLAQVKAIVFGDRFLAHDFKRVINNDYVDCTIDYEDTSYYESIIYAFQNLSAGDPLLSFMVETQCRFFEEDCDTDENGQLEFRSKLPHEFLLRCMLRNAEIRAMPGEEKLDRCSYHIHFSDKDREECRK